MLGSKRSRPVLPNLSRKSLRSCKSWRPCLQSAHREAFSGFRLPRTPLTTPEERIALFMRLFRCRDDVFPKMWENQKKGTRGYSPACSAEWVRGICDKPRIRCSECQNRAFIPFDESVIRGHLEGSFTVGTYTIREAPKSLTVLCALLALSSVSLFRIS